MFLRIVSLPPTPRKESSNLFVDKIFVGGLAYFGLIVPAYGTLPDPDRI